MRRKKLYSKRICKARSEASCVGKLEMSTLNPFRPVDAMVRACDYSVAATIATFMPIVANIATSLSVAATNSIPFPKVALITSTSPICRAAPWEACAGGPWEAEAQTAERG